MTITVRISLMVVAFICLFLAALNINAPRVNLMALGLALWALALIAG